jgi:hypothetical protein
MEETLTTSRRVSLTLSHNHSLMTMLNKLMEVEHIGGRVISQLIDLSLIQSNYKTKSLKPATVLNQLERSMSLKAVPQSRGM